MADKLVNGWTPAEVAQLAEVHPEMVNTYESGEVVPTVTRDEFLALAARYESMFRDVVFKSSGDAATDELMARYPTMFTPKEK